MFEQAQNCLLPMGITSENVAHRFGVSRKEQDLAAVSWICVLIQDFVLFYNLMTFELKLFNNYVVRLSLIDELLQLLLLVDLKTKLSQFPPRYLPLQGILNLSLGSWVLNKPFLFSDCGPKIW